MKCPFCNTELRGTLTTLSCQNERCESSCWPMDSRIWQALIDGKKAQEALQIAIECLVPIAHTTCRECCDDKLAQITLDQIKEITKPKEE